MKFGKKVKILILSVLIILSNLSPSLAAEEIKLADAGWDSVKVHNAIVSIILENVFDRSSSSVPGASNILHEGMLKNELQINMEVWTDNLVDYPKDLDKGLLVELGVNFDDNDQGLYVPRYVIEGDSKRGIKPMAKDLKTVKDLKKYSHIFKDEQDANKGRIYGATPGWEVDEVLYNKYKSYGLDKDYNYFRPGSDAAHDSALVSAYDKGEAIVSYYWEPTWIMGLYDFVLLEDEPFDQDRYKDGYGEFPSVKVAIAVSNEFYNDDKNLEIVEFLKKYKTSSDLNSKALAYMQENDASYHETALWFIKEHKDLVESWLTPKQATKLYSSLDESKDDKVNFLKEFPFKININYEKIDKAVRNFSNKHDRFFSALRSGLNKLVSGTETILVKIPWFIIILLVIALGYRNTNKLSSGLFYGLMLFTVGLLGLWNLMLETLAIVISSVVISLILGFPLGILVSSNDRADKIVRPILDALQTMPVFVYLIPALLFFGLGKPPAVIATTIYAIVPIIRMTNHGIRNIDKEVVEASYAFGATELQTLINVKIPQALPTIMAGVNQTIMMAMSMVVTTSMIGATGLGMEVLMSVNRIEIGRGLVSGGSVVILAILLDRLTQGLIKQEGDKNE